VTATAPPAPPISPTPSSADSQAPSPHLALWVGIQIVVATIVVVWVASTSTLRPSIALPWAGVSPDDSLRLGLAFWLGLGLFGGLRSKLRAGGSVMTFSMPFIVAGTLLGGPLAGALLGFFSEFEVREIRTQPWYGTLANHAVSIISAVTAAYAGDLVRSVADRLIPAQPTLAFFIVALATALTFATVNIGLVIPTLALKSDIGIRDASRSYDATYRATSAGEAILAWLMALTYATVGWGAPIACVALVVIIWQKNDQSEDLRHDEKTGLLNATGFDPRLAEAIAAARLGQHRSALVLLDLDKFKEVNDVWLEESGDEVLRVTANRLLTKVRGTDSVGRSNRAGDEFTVLLQNVDDADVAVRLAERLQNAIRQPVPLPRHGVDVTVDVSIGIVVLDANETRSQDDIVRLVNARMKHAKDLGSAIVVTGEEDEAARERRQAAGPRRQPPRKANRGRRKGD
jgi:diguanylate cyclase (GGDEF)-like protein